MLIAGRDNSGLHWSTLYDRQKHHPHLHRHSAVALALTLAEQRWHTVTRTTPSLPPVQEGHNGLELFRDFYLEVSIGGPI